ncbi:methionine--tRNA ligase [bacterium]|nr:methionine--tRNA ligase [bacterium]
MSTLFYTTAIDYVNSLPHIGTAYEKIGTDILVRWNKLLGQNVLFQMGNDEHSANVQKAAEGKNLSPKAYCDGMRPQFEDIWKKLNISYDNFIQTSDPRHEKVVYEFFDRVVKKGDIEERDYEGWYCESCEAFYTEKDLENGLCKNHQKKPKWLKEKNYFFKLKKYTDQLLAHIEKNPNFILPAKRKNEVVNFIKGGLEDFSISRSTFTWGIPVPLNQKHVFYVWFDALINYISLLDVKNLNELEKNPYWQNVTHIVGKDITRFHCIIWPAMLMSAGLPLPKHVFGHGFVYLKGEKMSKSLGNVVTPLDILAKYPDFGSDALRYTLMRNSSFGDDADFTWDGFIERYNADLANGLGNLAARILGMIWKYQDGKLAPLSTSASEIRSIDKVIGEVSKLLNPMEGGDVQSHLALEKIWAYITSIDQYIDKQAPWTLAKEKKTDILSNVLTEVVHGLYQVCLLCYPFIPTSIEKIWTAYGFDNFKKLSAMAFADLKKSPLNQAHSIKEQKLNLFPRIIMEEKTAPTPAPAPKKEETLEGVIDIKDFGKVDLRVAKVLSAEKVEGTDKLLKLQVELGSETRQMISGIAQHYTAESLVGKLIVIVANLKPAKIKGIESFGMLLAAKDGDKLVLVTPEAPIGSNAKVG